MPIGTFTRNTRRQPTCAPALWMIRPPTSGPIAVSAAIIAA